MCSRDGGPTSLGYRVRFERIAPNPSRRARSGARWGLQAEAVTGVASQSAVLGAASQGYRRTGGHDGPPFRLTRPQSQAHNHTVPSCPSSTTTAAEPSVARRLLKEDNDPEDPAGA